MTIKEFQFNTNNHFVAMEYYALILNRTFLCLITDDFLIGLKVNGLVSVEGNSDFVTKTITSAIAVKKNLSNPYSYIRSNYLKEYENVNLLDGSVLKIRKSNFVTNRNNIKYVYYDSSKKWGMGYYPHNGKVYVTSHGNKKREFIILGNQSGKKIADIIPLIKKSECVFTPLQGMGFYTLGFHGISSIPKLYPVYLASTNK